MNEVIVPFLQHVKECPYCPSCAKTAVTMLEYLGEPLTKPDLLPAVLCAKCGDRILFNRPCPGGLCLTCYSGPLNPNA